MLATTGRVQAVAVATLGLVLPRGLHLSIFSSLAPQESYVRGVSGGGPPGGFGGKQNHCEAMPDPIRVGTLGFR